MEFCAVDQKISGAAKKARIEWLVVDLSFVQKLGIVVAQRN
jgi:hypothetical protein